MESGQRVSGVHIRVSVDVSDDDFASHPLLYCLGHAMEDHCMSNNLLF